MNLPNYIQGQWLAHEGAGIAQFNAVTGEQIGTCGSDGLDYAAMRNYAIDKGGAALRKMTFQERGLMLKGIMNRLLSIREI